MRAQSEAARAVAAVAAMPAGRWLVAVSGGRDSMVLLHALATARADEIAAVATFDHGTGPAARKACRLVERTALESGLPVVSGTMAALPVGTEAEWRAERWRFLRAWAEELQATVVTAHTQDDQIETVVLRILRGAGARGLAGMDAAGAVMRPLLGVPRDAVVSYARAHRVRHVEDPSNESRAHQRNRARLDLLPALEATHPGFGTWCLELAARAGAVRAGLERVVDSLAPEVTAAGALVVRAAPLDDLRASEWAALWPALAGRVGVAMDRRGIERAAAWAPLATPGSSIPLAGGASIERTAATFVVRGLAAGTTPGVSDYILNE